jgi:UDP-sugar pyrophosphorylase
MDAAIAMNPNDKYQVISKPHGHGDVHFLMYKEGIAKQWLLEGKKWVVFFQDTNGLGLNVLPAALGVSTQLDLLVNSVCIPRIAKQAVGAITKLINDNEKEKEMTINVEYNQLDPLLRATTSPTGDVNDSQTGKSPYPGNINQLIFSLDSYVHNLERSKGVMVEFVNPKYTDDARTLFKKPTRLECMMQDYPKLLQNEDAKRVGFTTFPSWICYSPCKNNIIDAASLVSKGIPAASAWTAESDQYNYQCQILRIIGCQIPPGKEETFKGIPAILGPRIIIDASTALFINDFRKVFPYPHKVKISKDSTLIVQGNVIIEELDLDGALKINAKNGTRLKIIANGENGKIVNDGHRFKVISETKEHDQEFSEIDHMRGFVLNIVDEHIIDNCDQQYNDVDNMQVYIENKLISERFYLEKSKCTCNCC